MVMLMCVAVGITLQSSPVELKVAEVPADLSRSIAQSAVAGPWPAADSSSTIAGKLAHHQQSDNAGHPHKMWCLWLEALLSHSTQC